MQKEHDPLSAILLLLSGALCGLTLLMLYAETLSYVAYVPEAVLSDILPTQVRNIAPEPWELRLYHTGLWLVPLCMFLAWLGGQVRPPRRTYLSPSLFGASALLFLGLFLFLHHDDLGLTPLFTGKSLPWETIMPTSIVAWVIAGVAAVVVWIIRSYTSPPPSPLPQGGVRTLLFEACILLIALFLIFFDPPSLRPFAHLAPGDADWFLTPIHDVLQGKHLLVESSSQYGFLLFYFLAPIFKVAALTVQHFNAVLAAVHMLYYAVLYLLLRVMLPSRRDAIVGWLFILGLSYFKNEQRHEIYGEPSVGRLRNVWDIPVMLCFALELVTTQRRWFAIGALCMSIGLFWNADIGLAIFVASIAYTIALPALSATSIQSFGKDVAWRLATVMGTAFFFGLLPACALYAMSGSWPAWNLYLGPTRLYAAGFGAIPMPVFGSFWLILGAYIFALVFLIHALITRTTSPYLKLLCFAVPYGVLVFHYYLNRSFVSNLWAVAMPATLCLALIYAHIRSMYRYTDISIQRRVIDGCAVTLLSLALLGVITGSWSMLQRRYIAEAAPIAPEGAGWDATLAESVAAIHERIPEGQRAGVISNRDALFTIAADRANAFHYPMLDTVFTVSDLEQILQKFVDEQHTFLFVDAEVLRCTLCQPMVDALLPYYEPTIRKGVFVIYQRKPIPSTPLPPPSPASGGLRRIGNPLL